MLAAEARPFERGRVRVEARGECPEGLAELVSLREPTKETL